MKIVFGLGNVGREYENTRHNMGFMFLDYLYPNISYKKKFDGMYAEIIIDNEKVLLVKPCKYMNLSGEVVSCYINYYKVDLDDVFVIHDDLDMNLGTFKLTYNHSSGGHNGIKNIFNNINSNSYLRLKLGISKNGNDIIDYVLGKFSKEECSIINNTFSKLADIVSDFVKLDRDKLMNKYNSM